MCCAKSVHACILYRCIGTIYAKNRLLMYQIVGLSRVEYIHFRNSVLKNNCQSRISNFRINEVKINVKNPFPRFGCRNSRVSDKQGSDKRGLTVPYKINYQKLIICNLCIFLYLLLIVDMS